MAKHEPPQGLHAEKADSGFGPMAKSLATATKAPRMQCGLLRVLLDEEKPDVLVPQGEPGGNGPQALEEMPGRKC